MKKYLIIITLLITILIFPVNATTKTSSDNITLPKSLVTNNLQSIAVNIENTNLTEIEKISYQFINISDGRFNCIDKASSYEEYKLQVLSYNSNNWNEATYLKKNGNIYTANIRTPANIKYTLLWVKASNDEDNLFAYKMYASSYIPATPTNIKIKNESATSLKITYTKVKNAYKYQIYRSTTKGGIYEYINYSKTDTYIDTKVKPGKTYYYKIKAVRQIKNVKYYGHASKGYGKYVVPAKTSLNKLKNNKIKQIEIGFYSKGATKYQIFRSTNKKTFKLIKTTSKKTYVDKNVKSNKKYYYKVRAYKLYGNKKYYGSYSTLKSRKVK